MKDLLAVITPLADISGGALECATTYALALARLSGAHLSGLIVEIEPDSPASPVGNVQAGKKTGNSSVSTTERRKRTIELIQAAAKLANVPCTFLPEGRFPSLQEELIGYAQVRDLVIFEVKGPLRYPRQGVVEAVLFRSGRPLVLIPSTVRPFAEERVLVAWDATRSAARALHDALPLLIRAREVVIVSIRDDKQFSATLSGEDICRYLGRWDINSRFEAVQRAGRNVGDVLLDCAARINANLLVMGGFGHPREREFVFGSATRDVFQSNLEIAVLLSH